MTSDHKTPAPVRTRFAPSPTGEPHLGIMRTAIFAWLQARANGGTFIVRVEDTDQQRKQEGTVELLLEALRWLGVDWDEGPEVGGPNAPYFQSERLDHYHEVSEKLLADGNAYECFCAPERLAEVQKQRQKAKLSLGYDRNCRDLTADERERRRGEDITPVVRFKMPLDGTTVVRDIVRGEVSFENKLLDDFVIVKSDGFPTYHLAHLVDDHLMGISHVIRAEEWLPSLPRHVRLYEALGWEEPAFAHVSHILAPDRSKLSKRHGDTSVLEYRAMGYLPDAMLNFLTLLGWSLDDKTELIPRENLQKLFTLDRVSKSPAVFHVDKLEWMNGQYIRNTSSQELAVLLLEHWRDSPPEEIGQLPDRELLEQIAPLIRERLKTLTDAAPLIAFFFRDHVEYESEELIQKGMDRNATKAALEAALGTISELDDFHAETMEDALRSLGTELGLKPRQLFGALRVATTGQKVAPPLFESMEIMGKRRTVEDLKAAVARL